MINETHTSQVIEALEKNNGNLDWAAPMLGCSTLELTRFLASIPDLKARWLDKKPAIAPPISEIDALHRPSPLLPTAPTEEELRIAAKKEMEDKLLSQGLEAVCHDPKQLELAISFHRLVSAFFKGSAEVTHGGMIKSFLDCCMIQKAKMERLERIQNDLVDLGKYPYGSKERDILMSEEAALTSQYVSVTAQVIRTNEVVQRSAFILAQIKARQSKMGRPAKMKAANMIIDT